MKASWLQALYALRALVLVTEALALILGTEASRFRVYKGLVHAGLGDHSAWGL